MLDTAYGSSMRTCVLLPWAPWNHPCHPESSEGSSSETLTIEFSTQFGCLDRIAKEGKLVQRLTQLGVVVRLDNTAPPWIRGSHSLGCCQVRQHSSPLDLSPFSMQSPADQALSHKCVHWGFPDGRASAGRDQATNSRKSPTFHTR